MDQSKNENWVRMYRGKEISSHKSQITKLQKLKERVSHKLLRKLLNLEVELGILKKAGNDFIEEVYRQTLQEKGDAGKTTFEFTCFDGSILIRRNMNVRYYFHADSKKVADEAVKKMLEVIVIEEDLRKALEEFLELKDDQPSTVIRRIEALFPKCKPESIEGDAFISINESIEAEVPDPIFRVYTNRGDDGEMEMIITSLSKI